MNRWWFENKITLWTRYLVLWIPLHNKQAWWARRSENTPSRCRVLHPSSEHQINPFIECCPIWSKTWTEQTTNSAMQCGECENSYEIRRRRVAIGVSLFWWSFSWHCSLLSFSYDTTPHPSILPLAVSGILHHMIPIHPFVFWDASFWFRLFLSSMLHTSVTAWKTIYSHLLSS